MTDHVTDYRRKRDMVFDLLSKKFGERTGEPKSGFYPELSNMVTGSGWISLGPGYRRYFANDNVFFDASGAVSWHLFKMAQARVEAPKLAGGHLALGVQGMWQDETQVNYFGIGSESLESQRSEYRLMLNCRCEQRSPGDAPF